MQDNDKKAATLNELQLSQQTNYNNLPEELQAKNRWVCFKFVEREGQEKPSKVPMNPWNVKNAACNKPETWSDFQTAISAMAKYNFDGIGFQLGDGIFGVDLDNCFDNDGNLSNEAEDIVSRLNSYTEISPSGKGLHILALGKIPEGERKNTKKRFEMYSTGRFFTVTGSIFENRTELREATNEINIIHEKYFHKEKEFIRDIRYENLKYRNNFSEDEILEKAMNSSNGYKFRALWNGDISEYSSQSESDQAFCNYLAFWCGKDAVKMDSLFRQSGLMRNKWDKKHGSQTYGQMTVNKAIADCSEVYGGNFVNHFSENKKEINQNFDWQKPVSLDEFEISKFPIEAFPPEISEYLKSLSVNTQTAPEMGGVLMLGVLAACNQRKYKVKISPTYYEQLSLYTVAIAEPGELKSAVINAVTKPIKEYQFNYNQEHGVEIAQSISAYNRLKKRLEELEKEFAKGKATSVEVDFAVQELKNFKPKAYLTLFLDNATTEKLVDVIDGQGGKVSVISSEGGIFKNFGSDYKRSTDADPYLKAHDGDFISFMRISGRTNEIEDPALSMIITTQPKRINNFIKNEEFRECGLVARFLMAICESNQGDRNVNPPDIQPEIIENYQNLVMKMLEREASNKDIILSDEARKEYLEYKRNVEKKLPNEWYYMRDFGGKAAGTMLRLAGLLHCAELNEPQGEVISPQTIEKAVLIMDCLCQHIQKAYQIGGANEKVEGAKYILKRIKNLNKDEFQKQELYQACKGRIETAKELDIYLEFLSSKNHLKVISMLTGGRSSEKVILNPEILSLKALKGTHINTSNTLLGVLGMENREGENNIFETRRLII